MNPLLKADKISKGDILFDLSLEMKENEMVAVMGPSGSGKSTLLYQIAGMDTPDSGTIILQNHEITGLSEDEKAKVRLNCMGFVFQQMNMMENLNILDNILLPARYAQKSKKANKKSTAGLEAKANQLMKMLSVEDLKERKINEVSGGQLQRTCICRAMMNQPQILLADEPTGALNRRMADEVMNAFISLNRKGVSILMVTHDGRVASQCERVLYLLDGKIRDELVLGKFKEEERKEREEAINQWLMQMGW